MYELVNTSLPNGLLAGTHGFATAAMTKGMPDAVRTRVENFCAYPHRTSAHDASYHTENPVNWFHLKLPNGDHVVGRTAPADFDYTGRTNRLARTLVFSANEMSVAGGAAVLQHQARALSEAWSGEPRYLDANKTLVGQLAFLPRDTRRAPANWIRLLGADGEKTARRFAALLAKNVRTGGKSLYFKASTAWDATGDKLLGLIGDLIDMLPDDLSREVTFSTFAPCVPNGVTCHIRCVFDKDRSFDVASTTSPWLDCADARVVHGELLPDEPVEAIRPTTKGMSGGAAASSAPGGSGRETVGRSAVAGTRADGAGAVLGTWKPAAKDDSRFYLIVGGALILALCCLAGGAIGYIKWDQRKRWAADEQMRAAMEAQRQQEEAARQAEAERKEREARAEQEKRDREAKEAQEKRRQEEEARKAEVEAKKKDDAEAQRKAEEAADRLAKADAEAKAEKEQKEQAEKADLEKPFWELKLTAVLKENKTLEEELDLVVDIKGGDKKDTAGYPLTNENSVVVWFLKDGKLDHFTTQYKRSLKGMKKTPTYELMGMDKVPEDARWIVYRVRGRGDAVYWQWGKPVSLKLFEKEDAVALDNLVFGSEKRVADYFKKQAYTIFYKLQWNDKFGSWECWCKDEFSLASVLHSGLTGIKSIADRIRDIDGQIARITANNERKAENWNHLKGKLEEIKTQKGELAKLKSAKEKKKEAKQAAKGKESYIDQLCAKKDLMDLLIECDLTKNDSYCEKVDGKPTKIRQSAIDALLQKAKEKLCRQEESSDPTITNLENQKKELNKKQETAKLKHNADIYRKLDYDLTVIDARTPDIELDKPKLKNEKSKQG